MKSPRALPVLGASFALVRAGGATRGGAGLVLAMLRVRPRHSARHQHLIAALVVMLYPLNAQRLSTIQTELEQRDGV